MNIRAQRTHHLAPAIVAAMLTPAVLARATQTRAPAQTRPAAQSRAVRLMSAAGLLQGMARAAASLAQRGAGQGRAQTAAIWQSWAGYYAALSREAPPQLSAAQFTAINSDGCARVAIRARAAGDQPRMAFWRASSLLWLDLNRQLASGAANVRVAFPGEMLRPLPGEPGTPWVQFRPAGAPAAAGAAAPSSDAAVAAARRQQALRLLAQLQTRLQQPAPRSASTALPFDASMGIEGMLNRLNSMSQTDVNRLMAQPNLLNQFEPWWWKSTNGNPLALGGIPKGLMGGLADLSTLGNPQKEAELKRLGHIAEVNGNIAAGMAAEQKVRASVGAYEQYRRDDNALFEQLMGLYAVQARTGETFGK